MVEEGTRSVRCIVKLGGAAITSKNEIETINQESLAEVCKQLRRAMAPASTAVGMDWSRRTAGSPVPEPDLDELKNHPASDLDSNFIIVHGAGSFGHFQASKSGVHKGGLHLPVVKAGFVATRISVTSLNLEIVRALAREGMPSVGISPFACGLSTYERNIVSAEVPQIMDALHAGFIPVLHGDAVLDHKLGCTILSGDVIIRHLAAKLMPKYVVFLRVMKTDVLGVYDRPPTDPKSVLLREIAVDEDGKWSVVKPLLQDAKEPVEMTVVAHDTTGGMETKVSEAALIAKLGIDVYITKVGTDYSLRALKGEVHDAPDEWLGTIIRSSKPRTMMGST